MTSATRLWDIFCRVIDNYGDIGVCWRLTADLASRGQRVRLWVDDTSALAWMAPGALQGAWPGVQVHPWEHAHDPARLAGLPPAAVWIEGFGCEIAPEFVAHRFGPSPRPDHPGVAHPVWLNLEYLSAQAFVERAHGLPSPLMHGPAAGHTRHFFYPGFTPATGGLLREPDLALRQARFDRAAWLTGQGIAWHGEQLVSLFCYEPRALAGWLDQLRTGTTPTRLLVTSGRAAQAVQRLLGTRAATTTPGQTLSEGPLSMHFLPSLSQTDFDHLLWSCDLNLVRGEDSLVRALWAGRPWVWQIYPQHDLAHHAKLQALLQQLGGPDSWQRFHLVWNGLRTEPLPAPDLGAWARAAGQQRDHCMHQSDLSTRLLQFVDTRLHHRPINAEKS